MDGIGERLREARTRTRLTMQEVVDELDGTEIGPGTRGTLSNYEKGKTVPRADYLLWLCLRGNVTPGWVLTGEPPVEWNREEKESATRRACAALLHRIADWLLEGEDVPDVQGDGRWYERQDLFRVMEAAPTPPESLFGGDDQGEAGNGS